MKKTISVLLLAALLLTAGAWSAPAALAAETTPSETLGEVDGAVYTNEFFGLRAELDDDWHILSDLEIQLAVGLSANLVSDEDLAEQMKKSGGLMDFYALNLNSANENLNIQILDLGTTAASILGEKTFLELSLGVMKDTFTQAGVKDLEVAVEMIDFSGEEHASLNIRGLFNGVLVYERMIYLFRDRYAAVITVASGAEERSLAILEFFAPEEDREIVQSGNLYIDPDSKATFPIPEGWEQTDFNREKEYLDAKFVPVGQSLVIVMYGCEDAWASMSPLEKAALTRADINNDIFTAEEIAEYIGVSADSVDTVTYGANEYYRTYVFTMEFELCVHNGYLYAFEYMGPRDGEYHADYEEILAGAIFPE